jgi:hypothetical protein
MKRSIFLLAIVLSVTAYSQIPKSGLVLYYPFNGNANDESGNSHNGTVVNAIPDTDRFGNLNSAFRFDGNSGTERYIYSNIGKHDTISFSVWFKSPYPTTMYPDILNYGSSNRLDIGILGNHPTYIQNGNIGKVQCGAVIGGSWTAYQISNNKVIDGNWHNITVCFIPNDSMYEYLDNKFIGAKSDAPNNPSDDLMYIGREINDNAGSVMHQSHFNGSIDDIRIYNRKLNKSEISNLFYEGKCVETVYDTIYITVHDTILVSVKDTLLINAVLTGINPPNNVNSIKIFPNPSRDHITINYGNYSTMSGYTLKISNSLGQQVYTTLINQQQSYLNLSDWGGKGIYYITIIDKSNKTIENKKIVLQ